MKTLLVPLDFSGASRPVLATAKLFAQKFRSRVVLVHALMPPTPVTNDFSMPVAAMQEVAAISAKVAQKRLDRYAKTLRAARIKTETSIVQGPPGYVLSEEAKRVKADGIIVGSHGHGKFYDLLVGSTASSILKKATCPVIVVPLTRRK